MALESKRVLKVMNTLKELDTFMSSHFSKVLKFT